MNVKIRVTLAFLSPLTRLHISKLLQRENCVFKKTKKTKKKTAVIDKDGAEKSDGATGQLEAYQGQWNLIMHYLPWELIS